MEEHGSKERLTRIEVWSDVVCPFCYIGKRRLEAALERFPRRSQVDVVWRSFLLDPETEAAPGASLDEHLAQRKGWSLEETRRMQGMVTRMATEAGLAYRLDQVVVANSLDAHRLIQLARIRRRDSAMEEALFRAYFCEGKDIGDPGTLLSLARAAGLDATEAEAALHEGRFTEEIVRDHRAAIELGTTGVPFFVFDRRYAIAGAQPLEAFLDTLQAAFEAPESSEAGQAVESARN